MSDDNETMEAIALLPEPKLNRLPNLFVSSWQAVHRILNDVTGLYRLTEKETKDAGVYLGYQRHE